MAKYWVGNTGTWSDDANWSASDGGTGGDGAPSSTDDVYFTGNSFSADNQIVTIDADANCSGIDEGALVSDPQTRPVTLQFDNSANLIITNTLTSAGIILKHFEILSSATSSIVCAGTGTFTVINLEPLFSGVHSLSTQHQINIIINGDTYFLPSTGITDSWFENLTVNSGGILQIQSSTNYVNNISVASGGELDFTNTDGQLWALNWSASSGATITDSSGGTTLLLVGADPNTIYPTATFAGGNQTGYPKLEFSGTITTVTGSNTAASFTFDQGATTVFTAGTTQTGTASQSYLTSPAPGPLTTLQSSSSGSQYTLTTTSGQEQDFFNTKVSDMNGGGGVPYVFDGTSVNGGGNSNLTFPSSGGSFLLNFL